MLASELGSPEGGTITVLIGHDVEGKEKEGAVDFASDESTNTTFYS